MTALVPGLGVKVKLRQRFPEREIRQASARFDVAFEADRQLLFDEAMQKLQVAGGCSRRLFRPVFGHVRHVRQSEALQTLQQRRPVQAVHELRPPLAASS